MSLRRNSEYSPDRKHNGVAICQVCDKPATIRGRYCCEDHAEEFRIRSSEAYARQRTFERDAGVCAECGLNTMYLSGLRSKANGSWQRFKIVVGAKRRWRTDQECRQILDRYIALWVKAILKHGIPKHLWREGALWHSDHIVPVVRGGGETGMKNRQTLCFSCHDAKTIAESSGRMLLGKNKMDYVLSGKNASE